jgi:hypothetical protein
LQSRTRNLLCESQCGRTRDSVSWAVIVNATSSVPSQGRHLQPLSSYFRLRHAWTLRKEPGRCVSCVIGKWCSLCSTTYCMKGSRSTASSNDMAACATMQARCHDRDRDEWLTPCLTHPPCYVSHMQRAFCECHDCFLTFSTGHPVPENVIHPNSLENRSC